MVPRLWETEAHDASAVAREARGTAREERAA